MKKTLVIITVSCLFFACGNTNENPESTSVPASDSVTEQAVQADPTITAPVTTPDHSGAVTAPAPAPVNVSATPNTSTATGMNPAHGEPGHRCDIAVGAPLNSAPATAPASNPVISTSPAPTSAPVMTPSSAPAPAPVTGAPGAPATTTAPGMNPPHGQPGHDCAIAVGAPLKK